MIEKHFSSAFFEVAPPLDDVISHFYHFQTTEDTPPFVKHFSPDLEMMLIFNFGPALRISFNDEPLGEKKVDKTAVIGPLRKMLNYELLPGTNVIVANFTFNGFYRLFKIPLNELGDDEILDPDILIDKTCFSDLWSKTKLLNRLEERIQLLKDYASSFILPIDEAAQPLIKKAGYFHEPTIQPVKAMASDTNLSERSIQLRFQKYVGYSPKELLRFLRFKTVVQQILNKKTEKVDLFELIEGNGYHDQSHLIKDFKYFLGTTPQKFIKNYANHEFCTSKMDQTSVYKEEIKK